MPEMPSQMCGGENPLLVRAKLFVKNGDFDKAVQYCERVLDAEPRNGEAYFCRLMAERQVSDEAKLADRLDILDDKTFKLAEEFADPQLGQKLAALRDAIRKAEEAEHRKRSRMAEIRRASDERIELLDRHIAAEEILHGHDSELYGELKKCREAERQLSDPEAEPEVRAATEKVLAGAGDPAELERLAAEGKKRQNLARLRKIALIVAGAVVLLIIIIIASCNAIQKARRAEEAKRLEEELQKSLPGGVLRLSGEVILELVRVEAGTFTMGSPTGEAGRSDNERQHRVTLTRDFYLGRTEVTQAQWKAVMGNNPSDFKGDDRPVENVSWHDAMAFCEKLNEMGKAPKGWKFTLPTEAQWEYAARGGNKSRGYQYSGSSGLGEVAWYGDNSGKETHPVAKKRANELGLYDMSGNVWEWCLDWYGLYGGNTTDPAGPATGSGRVFRGGCWSHIARSCRSACRDFGLPGLRVCNLGFRLALVPVR